MPTQIQLRRGTSTQNAGFTGLAGEPTVNTTNWSLHVHDGTNQGGHELLRADLTNLDGAAASPTFTNGTYTGNLDVQGNLTVDGNATIAGNLTFGDAATDTVAFSADVNSNILPDATQTYALGSGSQEWAGVYAQNGFFTNNVDVSNQLSVNTNKFTVDSSGNIAASGDVTLTANTGTGVSTISPSGDLFVNGGGTIGLKGSTVTAEVGSAGHFYVQDSTYTNRLAVSENGRVTINEAYALPTADGTANQALVTNGLGTVSFATIDTDSVTEANNLYYTDARVQTYLSGGTATTIETTGNVTVGGDLIVNGTTTTLNTSTLDVEDLNITVAKGAADAAAADGGGLTIDLGSDGTATIQWNNAGSRIDFNKAVYFDSDATVNGNLAINGTTNFGGNTSVNGHHLPSTDAAPDGSTGFDLGSPDFQWRHLYVSGSSVYLAKRRMRIANDGTITVNTNDTEGYPESAEKTVATNQGVLATAAALSIALGSI